MGRKMKIGICDSNILDRSKYLALFRQIAKKHGIEAEFVLYSNCEQVLFLFEDKDFVDVLFTDIQMPQLSGLDMARELRAKGYKGEIVLLTYLDNKQYLLSGYDVNSLHYIIKDETPEEKIEEIFLKAKEAADKHNEEYILFTVGNQWVNIPIRSIKYFETFKRIVTVHYYEQSFEFYCSSFESLEKQLSGTGFIRTHRSYLVALREIENFSFHTLTIRNGKSIPVGRTYYPEIRKALAEHYKTHTVM